MRKADLLKNEPPQAPEIERDTANMFYVKGQPVLELTWISNETVEPQLIRHFVWKDHWATYRGKTAYNAPKWTKEKYETLRYGIWGGYRVSFLREEGKRQEQIFLESVNAKNYSKYCTDICAYEGAIVMERQNKAEQRKQQRITKRLREITPPLPNGFIKWGRQQDGVKWLYLLQEAKNGRCMDRRFKREERGEQIIITEIVRGISYVPGSYWDEWYYGQYFGRYGKTQVFWDKRGYSQPLDIKGALYPGTLDEITMINQNALRALKFDAAAGNIVNYAYSYSQFQRDDRAERIVKSNYPALISAWRKHDVYMNQVRPREGIHEMLGITKGRYKFLRSINASAEVIRAAQEGPVEHPRYSEKQLKALSDVKGKQRKLDILRIVSDYNLPMNHVIKLMKDELVENIALYRDYLDMAAHLDMNVRDEIVYRNKNWRQYHDQYVEAAEKAKASKRAKEVNRRFKNIRRSAAVNLEHFGWEDKAFIITVPKKASDIVEEGRLQHHCVGASDTYMSKMNNGESYILFFRKKESEDVPYYTIEATYDGKIIQAYSAYDRKPDWKEVHPILEKWRKEVIKRTKQEAKA